MTPEELDAIEARNRKCQDPEMLCCSVARLDVPALIAELRKAWGELRRRELVS
jgi:hypothetical protein